jgi:NAD(P)-dependent dehydrogenase (short-subunit alcohol dehydrogenase family)
VTGAARGIGQAIAAGLAERATRIVPGDIDDVSEASDLIGATGHRAVPVTPDVSDPSSTEAARDRVTDARGRVDIAAIKRKHDPQNLFHHNANIQPAQAGRRPDNTSDISMLGNHPITPAPAGRLSGAGTDTASPTGCAWRSTPEARPRRTSSASGMPEALTVAWRSSSR